MDTYVGKEFRRIKYGKGELQVCRKTATVQRKRHPNDEFLPETIILGNQYWYDLDEIEFLNNNNITNMDFSDYTAEKMRTRATVANNEAIETELKEVLTLISSCSEKGNFECSVYKKLKWDVTIYLQNMGYVVNYHSSQREGDETSIMWESEKI